MPPKFLSVSLKRFLILLFAYFLTRVLFLVWNWAMFKDCTGGEIALAFVHGLRFDTAAILLSNALTFLLLLMPARVFKFRAVRVLDPALLFVVNFICLGVNFIDVEFVKFIGKRTSYDLLFLGEDLRAQAVSVLGTYWYFLLSLIILTGVLVYLLPALPERGKPGPLWKKLAWRVGEILLIVLGVRGGFQLKPLTTMNAFFSARHELGLLALNTPFNLLKTKPDEVIAKTRYFATDAEAVKRLAKLTAPTRPPLGIAKGFNVVVLIIESFGSEYTGVANNYPGYTPFFDSLAREGFFYKYDFANARRSVDGVPAVLCGIPAMMDVPVITSDFASNRLDCLPKLLQGAGYGSTFVHGAYNGSMHFDSFANLAGFKNFVGLNEFPKGKPEDFDKVWGVLDEPMLQFATEVIDRAQKPTLLGLFTLSSHHPYYIPPKYKDKFPKGTLEIHESIGYTDYALKRFFETAKTKPWFNKTIFVITADHTQKSEHAEYADMIGPYRVPLLFYIPGLDRAKVPYDPKRITQQIDILPSVLDLLGVENPERLLMGQSVFDLSNPGRAYNFRYPGYWFLVPEALIDLEKPPLEPRAFTHHQTADLKERPWAPKDDERLLDLKAVLHYIFDGLNHNDLYKWKDKLKN